jgi:FolB domain-containing protein
MFTVTLSKLRHSIFIGLHESERNFPQVIEVCVNISISRLDAAILDDIKYTVDYDKAVTSIVSLLDSKKWCLLENVAFEIAKHITELSPFVEKVEVALTKRVHDKLKDAVVTLVLESPTSLN